MHGFAFRNFLVKPRHRVLEKSVLSIGDDPVDPENIIFSQNYLN